MGREGVHINLFIECTFALAAVITATVEPFVFYQPVYPAYDHRHTLALSHVPIFQAHIPLLQLVQCTIAYPTHIRPKKKDLLGSLDKTFSNCCKIGDGH